MNKPKDEGRRPPSIGEYLFAELRQAFQDMRQKVVEEGWFGRVVTAAPVVEVDRALTQDAAASFYGDDHSPMKSGHTAAERPSFEELWAPHEASPADITQERGIDIDR